MRIETKRTTITTVKKITEWKWEGVHESTNMVLGHFIFYANKIPNKIHNENMNRKRGGKKNPAVLIH